MVRAICELTGVLIFVLALVYGVWEKTNSASPKPAQQKLYDLILPGTASEP